MPDSRAFQQSHRLTLLLTKGRHQNIDHPDFALAAGPHVKHSALEDTLEPDLWHRRTLHGRCPPQSVGLDVPP